jgi:inner membrane protein YidH
MKIALDVLSGGWGKFWSWKPLDFSFHSGSMPHRRMHEDEFWKTTKMTDQIKEPLNVSTKLAFDRTRLAHDRTLMAWTRTATLLISFGFAVYKFFQLDLRGAERADRIIGPREFGLIMISIGLLGLLMATIQHRKDRNALRTLDPEVPRSLAALLAGVVAVLGILALIAVILGH